MSSLIKRYNERIVGVISCLDRIIIQGTLPGLCYASGMTTFLNVNQIRIFDYPRFAEPLRNAIRANAEHLAKESGIEIEFVRQAHIRKESLVEKVLVTRGDHPGLVHILSAMERCPTYKPTYNKQSGKSFLRGDQGKCLHYYFYFIDAQLGLCYVRVPTAAADRMVPFSTSVLLQQHVKQYVKQIIR